MTFKDDASGYRYVYFIKNKSDVVTCFKEYERLIANKFDRKMKILRSDNGREYCNQEMKQYLAAQGIVLENTAPFTPQQNGKSERDNRTIVESARTMIQARNLPLSLWAEAVNTAVYVLNRALSSTSNGKTPYEIWTGKAPSVSHLRVFGSTAFVHIDKQFRKKFDSKAKKMILVGYQGDSTNYRLYNPNTKKVTVSRDVVFKEKLHGESSTEKEDDYNEYTFPVEEEEESEALEEEEEKDNAEAHEVQQRKEPNQGRQLRDRSSIRAPQRYELEIDVAEYNPPITFQEAINSHEAKKWIKAVREELEAHKNNETWTLVPRRHDRKPIDSKWIFKLLRDTSGEVYRYKARLCARGFLQKEGLDYTETFSPVVRYDSLRVLLAIVTEKDLELVQFDVRTAFLHGELKEDIYMEIPEGLTVKKEENQDVVCKLNKSLYGLKQAPRCWSEKFREFLKQFKFKESEADKCVFRGRVEETDVYLALFVDDGLIAAESSRVLEKVVESLRNAFEITLGDGHIFVGIQIERNRDNKTMFLHQRAYTNRIIKKFEMCDAKATNLPADPHAALIKNNSGEGNSSKVPYREAVGSLMFLAIVSRPDIAYAVNSVSKFLNDYDNSHWQAVKRIFRYLIGTSDVGIEFTSGGSTCELIGFSDSDFASDVVTRRSTTGYAFCLANGIVTWSSQRQKLVTLSTTEAEYVAAAAAAKEAVWLRKLLNDLGCRPIGATILSIDNQSAIRLIKNSEFHKRTKHIDVKFHYIRETVESGEVSVQYVPTDMQRADIFTKALPKNKFSFLCSSLGLIKASTHSNGGSVEN